MSRAAPQLGLFNSSPSPQTWSVGDLNRYVRQTLEADYRLQQVRVRGEISGFKAYPSGHWYFTLKDAHAQLTCVMWRARAERQPFRPREGAAVVAVGHITLYEARGQFQFDVSALEAEGQGDLYQQFEQLKAKLKAEGLFDRPKRPLPAQPRLIGIVTSSTGAVLRDMVTILRRRWPLAQVLLSPTAVQGPDAPPQIVSALERLIAFAPDVVIVGRGGGAMEDLWCFNDERVARTIAAMPMPIVSAVGHETDFTIADFVADVRAPTPSAAAELVSAMTIDDLRANVDELALHLAETLNGKLQAHRWQLETLTTHLAGLSPRAQLRHTHQQVADLQARATRALTTRLTLEQQRARGLTQALHAVSPLSVLKRGYAILTRADGAVIRRAAEAPPGSVVRAQVSEGAFEAQVLPPSSKEQP